MSIIAVELITFYLYAPDGLESLSCSLLLAGTGIAFFVTVSVILEEYFHIWYYVYKGQLNIFKGIELEQLEILYFFRLTIGVRVLFIGEIYSNDMYYTSLSGPYLTIQFSLIFWIITILILYFFNMISHLSPFIFASSFVLPISSLLPIKIFGLESDGWKILKLIIDHKINVKKWINSMFEISRMSILLIIKGV